MSTFSFKDKSGAAPETRIIQIRDALKPTEGDLLAAGISQRTRIMLRTAAHVDVDGNAFAPYSEKGPYYYRPWDRPGMKGKIADRRKLLTASSRGRSTARFFKRLGGSNRTGELKVKGEVLAKVQGEHKDTIRFESYAAFKRSLGRAGVDLTGPRAPHMMQAITVKAGAAYVQGDSNNQSGSTTPASTLVLGIYGPKAEIATGHNTGNNRGLPKRRFFGASNSDARSMLSEIFAHVKARLGLSS